MQIKDTRIDIGGLMRCCIATIDEYVHEHQDEEVPAEPLVLDCKYEPPGNAQVVLQDGRWRWNHD